jgi:hypothetical protein
MSAADNRALFLAWLRTNHPDIYIGAMKEIANPGSGLGSVRGMFAGLAGDPLASITGRTTVYKRNSGAYGAALVGNGISPYPTGNVGLDLVSNGNGSQYMPNSGGAALIQNGLGSYTLDSSGTSGMDDQGNPVTVDSSGTVYDMNGNVIGQVSAPSGSVSNPVIALPNVPVVVAPDNTASGGGFSFNQITGAIASVANTITQTQAQQNLLAINTQRAQQGLPPLTMNGQIVTASMLAPANSAVMSAEKVLAGVGGSGMLIIVVIIVLILAMGNKRGA